MLYFVIFYTCLDENNELYSLHLKAILQPAVVRYADYLKAFYRSMPPLPRYKWPQAPSKKPFNLRLLESLSTPPSEGKAISLHCLVKPPDGCDKIGCVLVQGMAGVGKSCLTVELCQNWHDIDRLKKYPLVVLVRAQEKVAQEAKTLHDLLLHSDISFSTAVAQKVMELQGEGLLIVLDGLDQVAINPLQSVLLMKILAGESLPKATLLITTRTVMASKVMSLCKRKIDRFVELIGFTQDELEQHAESSLGFDSSLLSGFHDYLIATPAIQLSMYLPLNMAIAVEAYKEARSSGELTPTTLTELYMQLVKRLLQYHLLLQGLVESGYVFPDNLEKLPSKIYTQFTNLTKHAFNTLLNEESSWTRLCKNQYHLSFMIGVPELYSQKRTCLLYNYTSIHVQEILAAHYVMTLSQHDQAELYQKHFTTPRFKNVWKFFAGIDKLQSSFWGHAKAAAHDNKYLSSSTLQYLFEAHKDVPLEQFVGHPEVTFPNPESAEPVTALDCYYLGCCLAHSTCTLDLRQRLNTEMLHHLVLGLKSKSPERSSIKTLFLRPPITMETLQELRELPSNFVEGLDLSHCNLDKTMADAVSKVLPRLISLKQLDIRGNQAIGEGGMVKVLSALSSLKSLDTLNVINTGMKSVDLNALAPLLTDEGHLRTLMIGDEDQDEDSVNTLLHTTLTSSSLHTLQIWLTDLQPHTLDIESLLATEHSVISTLEFHGCKIGQQACCGIANGVCYNNTLRRLVLSMFDVPVTHHLTNDGATALAEMLEVNRTLETMEISFDKTLDKTGALAMMCSLEHNKKLQLLKLPQQNFSLTERSMMDSRIKWA